MTKILLIGLYGSGSVSLAPQILKTYIQQFPHLEEFEIVTKEFSIFLNTPLGKIVQEINREKADIIGFSMYIWNYQDIIKIIKYVKGTTIVGGPQVTGIEDDLLQQHPEICCIFTGEGELSFKKFLEYYSKHKRIPSNKITSDALIALDTIPSVYPSIFEKYQNLNWISIETSRGCPRQCKYCTWSFDKKMRYYPLSNVKENLDEILKQSSIKNIYICDSNLLLNKIRAKQILQYLIDKKTEKNIRYEFNAEDLDDELIMLLAQLPHDEFNFGVQTINEKTLTIIGRTFNKSKFENNYKKLVEVIPTSQITIDIIYGLPGDNIESYKNTLTYVMSLPKVDRILTNPLICLPGSEFYKNKTEFGFKLLKDSYLVESNKTFSKQDMELARKYSFFVFVLYLNSALKKCISLLAHDHKINDVDALIFIMDNIFAKQTYPDMVPSTKISLLQRNAWIGTTIIDYSYIIENFKKLTQHKYDEHLINWEQCYSRYYYKIKGILHANNK